jgi:hypothetical protein
MSTKVNGRVHTIGAPQQKSEKLTIQEVWVEESEQRNNQMFTNILPIQFVNDKTELIQNLKVGDEVEVGINIRGRVWNDKCFVSLNGWTITLKAVEVMPTRKNDDFPF